ncbi:MAG: TetR/AcrR family transcriptional regulator [Propionibacteriales bacterium]|nr:TetR/AcrR family transcriptional regulator [Propionibacteriales bacterium]
MTEPLGRRERKKAQTRQAIADAALQLFLERGYESVGVREVADAADVALSTLFKHFATKESLVFDLDSAMEDELVAAVRDRSAGLSVLESLRDHVVNRPSMADGTAAEQRQLAALIERTPALRDYYRQMWARHEEALATAIADEVGRPAGDLACAGIARFVLDVPTLAESRPNRDAAVRELFTLLECGWGDVERTDGDRRRPAATPT